MAISASDMSSDPCIPAGPTWMDPIKIGKDAPHGPLPGL